MLKNAGFTELAEAEPTKETLNRCKYFFTRDKSTLVAFAVGKICRRQRL
jgi:aspartyl aminopeptidase